MLRFRKIVVLAAFATFGCGEDVPMDQGLLDGPCTPSGGCNPGLACVNKEQRCVWSFDHAGIAGVDSGPCRSDGTCNEGLQCVGGICAKPVPSGRWIMVGEDTPRTYSWDSGHGSMFVVSPKAQPFLVVFGAKATSLEGFTSPVTHGTVPPGAEAMPSDLPSLAPGSQALAAVVLIEERSAWFVEFTP